MAHSDQREEHVDDLETLLTLESQFHAEGHALGVADGTRSGLVEGRVFGLEKGFEKFLEMGRLQGRAAVWSSRLAQNQPFTSTAQDAQGRQSSGDRVEMPLLSGTERLKKHVERLIALTDPETLSTENREEDVSWFEDRLKDARAKAMLVEKIVGETEDVRAEAAAGPTGNRDAAAGARRLQVRRGEGAKGTEEMEDFGRLRRGQS